MNVANALRPIRARWGVAFFVAAVISALGLAVSAGPQERQLTGTLEAGSVDNEVTIVVTNSSERLPVEGLKVSVAGTPRYLAHIRISPRGGGSLSPKQSQRFVITFNVSKEAPPGQSEKLTFLVSADQAEFDQASPQVTLRFVKGRAGDPPPR
jgi:uncharacterized membrane protein